MSAAISILYVGADSDAVAERAARFGATDGLSVTTAVGVDDAYVKLDATDIDCVVSEFRLPETDTFDLLSQLTASHPSLPVILLTADEPESLIHDAFEAGATDLFPESIIQVSYEPLINRIREVVGDAPAEQSSERVDKPDAETTSTDADTAPATVDTGSTSVASDATPEASTTRSEPSTAKPDAEASAGTEAAADAETDSQPQLDELDIDLSRLKELPREELLALLNIDDDPSDPPANAASETTAAADARSPSEPSSGSATSAGESSAATTNAPAESTPTAPSETAASASQATTPTESAATSEANSESAATYQRPDGLELTPGSTILVECGSQDPRKHDAHRDLLGLDDENGRNVLLIRYRSLSQARLESIASDAEAVKVITVGCSQPIPDSVGDRVETIHINNPNDVRRLGILATGVVNDWGTLNTGLSVSLDPLDILFNYKTVEAVFRFFHIFLGKLSSQGAVTQFHLNPSSTGEQNSNTIKPLFDHVVTIDGDGVALDGA